MNDCYTVPPTPLKAQLTVRSLNPVVRSPRAFNDFRCALIADVSHGRIDQMLFKHTTLISLQNQSFILPPYTCQSNTDIMQITACCCHGVSRHYHMHMVTRCW